MNYYVVFKTVNLVNGRWLYGVHMTADLFWGTEASEDTFLGNNAELNADIRRYTREVFRVSTVQAHQSAELALAHLNLLLTNEMLNDQRCYNYVRPAKANSKHLGEETWQWINNGKRNRQVPALLSRKLRQGWVYGKIEGLKETQTKRKKYRYRKRWITNGIEEHLKNPEDIKVLPDGYGYGRLKNYNPEVYKTTRESKWINNGKINKRIQSITNLPEGWGFGMCQNIRTFDQEQIYEE